MIQCKYCGATAEFPIDMKHREGCIDLPPRSYLPELYQTIMEWDEFVDQCNAVPKGDAGGGGSGKCQPDMTPGEVSNAQPGGGGGDSNSICHCCVHDRRPMPATDYYLVAHACGKAQYVPIKERRSGKDRRAK